MLYILLTVAFAAWSVLAADLDPPIPWHRFWLAHLEWIGIPVVMAILSVLVPFLLIRNDYWGLARASVIASLLLLVPMYLLAEMLGATPR